MNGSGTRTETLRDEVPALARCKALVLKSGAWHEEEGGALGRISQERETSGCHGDDNKTNCTVPRISDSLSACAVEQKHSKSRSLQRSKRTSRNLRRQTGADANVEQALTNARMLAMYRFTSALPSATTDQMGLYQLMFVVQGTRK